MKKFELRQIIKEEISNILNEITLTPRNIEGRKEKQLQQINQRIQDYIKGGSQGDLDLFKTPITSLPNNLKVGRDLNLPNTKITSLPNNLKIGEELDVFNTPLAKKYTEEQIRKMIEDKGGYVRGVILTQS